MVRWEPGSAERLQNAAAALFVARGFEQTTAADLAHAAGLTERTFFRHFGDKRDVLFLGQETFVGAFVDGVRTAPPSASPAAYVRAALESASDLFPAERREFVRSRQTVIDRHPALQERERQKGAELARAVADALRERGVPDPAAPLAAESTVTVFNLAYAHWLDDEGSPDLGAIAIELLARLLALDAR